MFPLKEMVGFILRNLYYFLGGDQWPQALRANPDYGLHWPPGYLGIGVVFRVVTTGADDQTILSPPRSVTGCSLQVMWLSAAQAVPEGAENQRLSIDSTPNARATSPPLRGIWVEHPSVPHELPNPQKTIIMAACVPLRTPQWPSLGQHSDHMLLTIGFQDLLVENQIEKKCRNWCGI